MSNMFGTNGYVNYLLHDHYFNNYLSKHTNISYINEFTQNVNSV